MIIPQIREGNGNPHQYSCLKNPVDRGAWWAAVHRVAELDTTEVPQHACMHRRRKWQPTPVFLTGESQGQRSLVGRCLWGRIQLDTTEATQHACMHWRRKWQPTPVFLPGESQGQRSLVGCCLWGRTESDMTEATQQQQQHISSGFSLVRRKMPQESAAFHG